MRRRTLRGAGISALALSSTAGCRPAAPRAPRSRPDSARAPTRATTEKTIDFSNWIGYVDPVKAKDTSTLEKFEQETGITVDYKNGDVNDNETFFAKVSPQLQDCKSTGRDVFVVTDWMAARMIDLGWIQKLDHANMPNVDANLIDFLKSPDWDPEPRLQRAVAERHDRHLLQLRAHRPGRQASRSCSPGPTSRARSSCCTEMRDTMGFMLLMQGSDPEDFTDDEFTAAIAELQRYVDNGQVRRFAGNDYVDDMKSGDIVACEAWSGDVINLLGGGKYKWMSSRRRASCALDRQHAGPQQGRAQDQRRES